MNYNEALEYISSVSWLGSRPGLDRVKRLCGMLGNPQDGMKFVHVAGTNGKGSFCAMTESILRAAGYRTGLFVSPYIEYFGERMQVNGKMIDNEELAGIMSYIKPYADTMKDDPPTEFELITAAGFEYFRRMKCEVVVLETGMGGRLDATNIIRNPLMSVITGISLDHTAILGDTIEKIAFEKAGIIKDGAPVLVGGRSLPAQGVIRREAEKRGSEMTTVDYEALEIKEERLDGCIFDFGKHKDMRINLAGLYQPLNAATVLSGIDILRSRGMKIDEDAVRRGLAQTEWKGRFEVLSADPTTVVYDGSHNPEGIKAASDSIKHYFGGDVIILTGVMKDKDFSKMAGEISLLARKVFTVTPGNARSLAAEKLAEIYRDAGADAVSNETIEGGVRAAYLEALKTGRPLVMLGSLYLYGDAKHALMKVISENANK